MLAGRSTLLTSLPAMLKTETFISTPPLAFCCFPNDNECAFCPGHWPFNGNQVTLGVNTNHFQVLGGKLVVAHAAGHPLALKHVAGTGSPANRTRRPPPIRLAVGF